jgi:hypothetical protein
MGKCFLLKVRWGAVPHGRVGVGLRTGACGDALLCSQQHSQDVAVPT